MKKNHFAFVMLLCSLVPEACSCQHTEDAISRIDLQLKKGQITVSKILSSDSLMYLHSLTRFREVIRSNARAEKLSMVTDKEPGTRISVKCRVTDTKGVPQKDLLVYVYQTSDKGWYSDTGAHILVNSGDVNHARLFGYLKTDDKGEFVIETIRPKGYPRSDLPAHIHIHFWSAAARPLRGPGELLFDDDPRLTPERKSRSLEEGYLISKNTGTEQKPVYEYKITTE